MREKLALFYHTATQDGLDRAGLLTLRYLSWTLDYHRRVGRLPPPIATALFRITRRSYASAITVLRKTRPQRYSDADPYKLLWVSPQEIRRTTGEPGAKRRGWVVGGEWDQSDQLFFDRTIPKSIDEHYVQGDCWSETVLAEDCASESELRHTAEKIETLHRSLRERGYRPQSELLASSGGSAWKDLNDAMHPIVNEIAVDIGRNGELLWNMAGQHRLALATVLGLDRVCVQVFRRHREWQALRESIISGGDVPERVVNHPDMQDIR